MVDVWFSLKLYQKNFIVELLFTNTDSLTYEIKSMNVYKEFYKCKDFFDFSNYSKDSTFYDGTNKKLMVKWNMSTVVLLLINLLD